MTPPEAHPAPATQGKIELDPSTRRLRPSILFGGSPSRFVRLSAAGVAAMDEIESGRADSNAALDLAARLIDADMAYRRPPPAATDAIEDVTIVIPVYDRVDMVIDLVDRLARSVPRRREVIIVDDASPPRSADRLRQIETDYPGVRVVRRDDNGGPAAARNTGVSVATTTRVLFVDSDCVVPDAPGWLEVMLGHLTASAGDSGPSVAAVAPRIVAAPPTSAVDRSRDDRLPPGLRWLENIVRRYDEEFCPLDLGPRPGLVGPDRRVRYVPTATLLVDLDIVSANLGSQPTAFDPDLRFGEDVDFVWRLVEHGCRVVYEPSVEVGHREPVGIAALARRRFEYGASAAELDDRHRGAVVHLVVSGWAALATAGVITGSVATVVAGYGAQAAILRRRLQRASLPTDELDRAVAVGLVQSALGVGRYLNQFWWPVIVAILISRRVPAALRARLLLLCLGRSIDEAIRRDGSLRQRLATIAIRTIDEATYGAGVWSGALAGRNLRVVRPRRATWTPKLD